MLGQVEEEEEEHVVAMQEGSWNRAGRSLWSNQRKKRQWKMDYIPARLARSSHAKIESNGGVWGSKEVKRRCRSLITGRSSWTRRRQHGRTGEGGYEIGGCSRADKPL